ncbi:MAG: hypothetical protein A3D96_00095 [Chlamydiae bacterium RIFCSPHIGHO2_12_FULL_44_59]|nr:MAG: hypothetical protein A2796_04100 [Chlamydiae bacterium RIFCSPHIGHO2_01_FULL_44_39]OGN60922.1 MAG: hypothetical protein A3D96_00095 [Chlamydiae bacterium RIFCSPHIGHO2_12_FULL_44_59]OGN66522.1 MAG: hypothetical protein A2978_05570 [Chlamydiae bacterium RIFCSPLOWO2_01_FULL_44_52]OGN69565.1 MAG: hypothetical protein A3I67_00990 [Chlamydiae bacterium RIFCSPLOWO2_02_FULL_45_22]OGN70850.1 MAG: hypothetical protein A3F79_05895 [Chlamydiae bacterium RIFCSPLOWO2_12_FULL_45_20]
MSVLYIFFAILGLGFLVFIHELGHYWVARRKGMRVEAFAIGFGKPIFSWVRDGVKWQICMLPFGGYVKIAGMQKEGGVEPSEIRDGFYGKRPWDRIQVAFAGPLVNIAFALMVFCILWLSGGRDKPFTEFTHRIGWVDPQSMLYEYGVRPGDVIGKYDGKAFGGFKDLLMASLMKGKRTQIEGTKINYLTGEKAHYDYTLKTYDNPELAGKDRLNTIGVLAPARYLIYPGTPLPANSPMQHSGIQPNDRVLWVNGEVIFSHQQLSHLTNEPSAFVTIQRNGEVLWAKVPRVQLRDFKLSMPEKGEMDDWQHEAGLKTRLSDLYFIPYNLSPHLVVESPLHFIEERDQKNAFKPCERCTYLSPLIEGDTILAVDGKRVRTPYELLTVLQEQRMLIIVERNSELSQKVSWKKADDQYDDFNKGDLVRVISSIGTGQPVVQEGNIALLSPIVPKPLSTISGESSNVERLVLGLPLADREVLYNPTPGQQFLEVLRDTYRTLTGLLSGSANPKYVAGPVGIVQIVHHSWMVGVKEALFWIALISLNLGIVNLLPLPVLDGGHIVFSIIELCTRRPIKAKTMEKMIIPFVVLLIGFFVFVTYHDITRLFSKFF